MSADTLGSGVDNPDPHDRPDDNFPKPPPSEGRAPSRPEIEHHVYASSFADPLDVARFRRCKARGLSDHDCFKIGDNGIGYWGDDCTGPIPMCALPPEDMEERWGSVDAAKHQPVEVSIGGTTSPAAAGSTICILADRMPHRPNIKNGAGIDLSPAAVAALRLQPPIMIRAVWRWA